MERRRGREQIKDEKKEILMYYVHVPIPQRNVNMTFLKKASDQEMGWRGEEGKGKGKIKGIVVCYAHEPTSHKEGKAYERCL